MYTDLSVNVSAPVVRTADRGFVALERLKVARGVAVLSDDAQAEDIAEVVYLLEKLFLWDCEALVKEGEFGIWLSRCLDWYSDFNELVETCYLEEVDTFIEDATDAGRAILDGRPFNPDAYDALVGTAYSLSESIWDHFKMLHYFASEPN